MTRTAVESNHLGAGQFYGSVPAKRSVSTSIITEVVHAEGRRLPEHSHELGFFSLLLEGDYRETYGRKAFEYRPFTVLWHRPGISHKDEIGRQGGRFLSVEITRPGIGLLESRSGVPGDFHERGTPLVWLACRLFHEFRNWQHCSDLVAEGLTLEMLAVSSRENVGERKKPPAWLRRVRERLDEDFAGNIAAAELADEAGVHPVHLATVFRKFYGATVGEYLRSRRIEFATSLLTKREIPLADIALDAGFSDQSHFTRVFRKSTGMTPGSFRESLG